METNGTSIKWQDPPKPRFAKQRRGIRALAPLLRKRKGAWALLNTSRSRSSAFTAATYWTRKLPGFEFTARSAGSKGQLYGRYVGK